LTLWRLELLRLWRTRRLIALAVTFGLIGLGIPILDHYLPEILKHAGTGGVRITVPPPTPSQTLANVGSNISQMGTLVLVVVAAASLAIDARPRLAIFYRTRARDPLTLFVPRYVTVSVGGLLTLALGVLAAWYETAVLIGQPRVLGLAGGYALEALWLCFVVATVALWASITPGVLAITGASLASLLLLALLANIPALTTWSPTALAGSLGDLAKPHDATTPWHAVIVVVPCTLALVTAGGQRLTRIAK
jgi:ABC-2 type transport system permease protein